MSSSEKVSSHESVYVCSKNVGEGEVKWKIPLSRMVETTNSFILL